MKKKYQSYNPNNARIFIRYNHNNPVKFEYIHKKGIFKIIFSSLFNAWCWWVITPLFIIKFGLDFFGYSFTLSPIYLLMFFVFPPFISSFAFRYNQKLISLIPSINMYSLPFTKHTNYKCVKKLDKRSFEIPLFKNIFLDYKATSEFSKYLEKVDIIEHKFKVETRFLFFPKKRKRQDTYWISKFYFKKIPTKGQLEIWFK